MSNLMITAPEIPTSAQQWMPDKADTFAEGLMEILRDAISLLRPDIMEASGACLGIIAAALIVSILQTFSGSVKKTGELAGAVSISLLLLSSTNSLIHLGAETVTELSEYGKLLLPVMTTALAATVGTGNIAGVTGAIAVGGPGAVFWMWVSALFGMVTKYSEVVLAVNYRERNEKGDYVGGPMYYIENGLGKKFKPLAVMFAVFGVMTAALGSGTFTQVNAITSIVNVSFDIPVLIFSIPLISLFITRTIRTVTVIIIHPTITPFNDKDVSSPICRLYFTARTIA